MDEDADHPQSIIGRQSLRGIRRHWPHEAVAYYDRVVDVMEELVKFTLLTRDRAPYLVDRYCEHKETAEELSRRVNVRSI